jgi:alanine-synthesizing transaminase
VTRSGHFARRSDLTGERTRVAEALVQARAAGRSLVDLTESNPTRVGLPYDDDAVRAALAPAEALTYAPHSFGRPEAREAVAAHIGVPAGRVVLTASTSEAYGFLFKLLCDPGDEVLVARPSYPLLDHLARFESVEVRSYPLRYDGEWHIDLPETRRAVTPRTRAVFVVSPNNPTGSFAHPPELQSLAQLGVPIVSDEVFAGYPLDLVTPPPGARALQDTLTFTLGGLSKECGLPQVKLAWMIVGGPEALAREALSRLEHIADAYLSVSASAQLRVDALLRAGAMTRAAIRERTRRNLATLRAAVPSGSPVDVLRTEGGWYAVLRVPRTLDEEAWVLALLDAGVIVHPGWFYDFADEAYLVLSLLPEEATFAEGIRRLTHCVTR